MDVSNASYYTQENNKNKGSQIGHTKKKIFQKVVKLFRGLSLNKWVRSFGNTVKLGCKELYGQSKMCLL